MDAVAECAERYLRDHPSAGADQLRDALERHFGLNPFPPDAPPMRPQVNQWVLTEQVWYTARFWWWWLRARFLPRRPSATQEEVERVVALLRPPSAAGGR